MFKTIFLVILASFSAVMFLLNTNESWTIAVIVAVVFVAAIFTREEGDTIAAPDRPKWLDGWDTSGSAGGTEEGQKACFAHYYQHYENGVLKTDVVYNPAWKVLSCESEPTTADYAEVYKTYWEAVDTRQAQDEKALDENQKRWYERE